MLQISVIICTHNPRPDYLQRVLDGLKKQVLPMGHWELLMVDNASLECLSQAWDLSWHPCARHIRENELGLTYARRRGFHESTGSLLVFVDDDNVLNPDYLRNVLFISQTFPQIGIWGGSIKGVFEVEPPLVLKSRLGLLAVGEITNDDWGTIKGFNAACPPGAGIAVRKHIIHKYYENGNSSAIQMLLGRRGNTLTSGEDVDLAWFSCEIGFGMGRFKQLCLEHLISAKRLTLDYFERLVEGGCYSNVFLHQRHNLPLPEIPTTILSKLRSWKQRVCATQAERRLSLAAERGNRRGLADLARGIGQ